SVWPTASPGLTWLRRNLRTRNKLHLRGYGDRLAARLLTARQVAPASRLNQSENRAQILPDWPALPSEKSGCSRCPLLKAFAQKLFPQPPTQAACRPIKADRRTRPEVILR